MKYALFLIFVLLVAWSIWLNRPDDAAAAPGTQPAHAPASRAAGD